MKNYENKISQQCVFEPHEYFPHTYQPVVEELDSERTGFFKCMGIMLGDLRHPYH
jgi:hypothetical protein